MVFTIFGSLTPQKSEKTQTLHNWFLISGGRSINKKGRDLGSSLTINSKYFLKILTMAISINWPNWPFYHQMIYVSKDILKMYTTSCANTYHDVITFEVDWMV